MKLSIAVSTPDARFSALALKGSFDDTFSLAKQAGFDGVEIAIKNPADFDARHIKSKLGAHGLELYAIGTGRAFGEEGLSFSDPDIKVRLAAIERIKRQIDFGAELGAAIIIGLILGKNPVTSESEDWAVEALRECAEYAVPADVTLVLEPINRYETSFIKTVDECLRFLDMVGVKSCKILLDSFHMNIEEASMEDSIRKAGARTAHVHVADSNRWHPGEIGRAHV